MNHKKVVLLDGYVDEPSCLGVPPYISPYIRYTYGALLHAGMKEEYIEYYLVDKLRSNIQESFMELLKADLIVIIAGTTVPGKYMGGKPISVKEIMQVADKLKLHNETGKNNLGPKILLGGPILLTLNKEVVSRLENCIDAFLDETGAIGLFEYMNEKKLSQNEILENINQWAKTGAVLTTRHPNYPNLVCEIETYRGCLRADNCSFCSEFLKQVLYTRSSEDIAKEVESLYFSGNKYFRIGAQTDLFMYGAIKENRILKPNPDIIQKLYTQIREKAPDLSVLHMDNANPATLSRFKHESKEIMKVITSHNTSGDTAAFGLESTDKKVLEANNIGTYPEETMEAIKLMNEIGGEREGGLPKLLPGINLLHGLKKEDDETYQLNYEFLKSILDNGFLLRRINIRQVIPVPGFEKVNINEYKFNQYKDKINKDINKPMLEKVFPLGTIITHVLIERIEGNLSYGRQLGTYPILIGIPGKHEPGCFVDVKIIDHGYRSITGLKYPFNINEASIEELKALPGIGKKRASSLFIQKPFRNFEDIKSNLDNSFKPEDLKRLNKCIDSY